MKKYTLQQISRLIGGDLEEQDPLVSGFCVDSRLAQPGNLFVALEGEHVDGHAYLEQAAAAGASAALVRQRAGSSLPQIRVKNTLKALQTLAKHRIEQHNPKIVGVTGSLGKTTTKDFIATILKGNVRAATTPKNYNSQIGLPLTILNHTEGDERVLVLEMAMTEAGNITGLVNIAPPDIAVITTIDLVHAGNFHSLDDIAKAKGEILSHPKTKVAIVEHEIRHLLPDPDVEELVTFSLKSTEADFFLDPASLQIDGLTLPALPVLGRHNLHNFLAAALVAKYLGLRWEDIMKTIPQLRLPGKRLETVEKKGVVFVNDSYNACTTSIKAALDSLPSPKPGGKTIAVIGGIVDLGKFSEACHREVGEYALSRADSLICFGPECGSLHACWKEAGRKVEWANEFEVVVEALNDQIQPGDVVLLKGSNNKQLWKVIEGVA